MTQSEAIQLLTIAGPIVAGSATIVAAIQWLIRRHARKMSKVESRLSRLEKERDQALRSLRNAEEERDQAQHELNAACENARCEKARADHNFKVGTALKGRLATVNASLSSTQEQIQSQRQDLERYEAQIDAVAKQDGRVWCARTLVEPPKFVPLAKRYQRRPTIISVLNLKGGVGKTTLTANLGGYLAHHHEKWVLLLDLDHQRSLTQTLFTSEQRKEAAAKRRIIQAVLRVEGRRPIEEVEEQVQGDCFSRLRVVGNSDAQAGYGDSQNLDDREMDLLSEWLLNPAKCDIRYLLREALHHSRVIQERYDYVVIDCPPRLTTACVNALAASDFVLIPAQAEPVSASSVSHLLRRLRPLRDAGILPDLRFLVIGNMVSRAADKKAREVKLLDQTVAAAAVFWKPLPVRLVKSVLHDSGNYARYQHDFVNKGRLQLPAIAVEDIRVEYAGLTAEIEQNETELITESEQLADESLSPSRVSP